MCELSRLREPSVLLLAMLNRLRIHSSGTGGRVGQCLATACDEARFFLKPCGVASLAERGVPCEALCR
jgi:hypothetical protein